VKVTETVTRECCQRQDLKPVEGSPKHGQDPEFMFCQHCGRYFARIGFMDAAGSRDWDYRPLTRQILFALLKELPEASFKGN